LQNMGQSFFGKKRIDCNSFTAILIFIIDTEVIWNLGVLEAHNVDRDGEMSEAISSVIQSALALSLSVEKIAQICGCGVDYVRQIQESMENVTAEQ